MHPQIIDLMQRIGINPDYIQRKRKSPTSARYANIHNLYSVSFLKRTFGIQPREGEIPICKAHTRIKSQNIYYDVYQIRQCEPINGTSTDYSTHKEFIDFMRGN